MKWSLLFLALLMSSFGWAAEDSAPPAVMANRRGILELSKSNPTAAQEKFLGALAKEPLNPKLHFNLGLTFELLQQMDKAKSSYLTALNLAQDPEVLFAANYNLGEMAQKAKQVDEALHYYQEALKYNPDSKETKTNIELLIQDQQGQGKDQKDQKDPKDQNKDGKGQGQDQKDQKDKKDPKDSQDPKDNNNDSQKNKENKDDKKQYQNPKPQPRPFKSEQLTPGDVNKILGEIKQQEQKIRAEFNKKEVKEQPRDKDW